MSMKAYLSVLPTIVSGVCEWVHSSVGACPWASTASERANSVIASASPTVRKYRLLHGKHRRYPTPSTPRGIESDFSHLTRVRFPQDGQAAIVGNNGSALAC